MNFNSNVLKSTILAVAFLATPVLASTQAAAQGAAQTEQAAETTLHSGEWTKKSFKSKGKWSIVERGGARFVVLSDDFSTRRAPDLKIFLSPQAAGDANGKNATDGAFRVAELSSNKGGQEYRLPDDLDLASFQSILIHCEAYSKLWSAADLS